MQRKYPPGVQFTIQGPMYQPSQSINHPRQGGYWINILTDGQIAKNHQIDVRELRVKPVNAHTIVCGRSAITNRVRASVWAFTHTLANIDLAVETLFSITPVPEQVNLQRAVVAVGDEQLTTKALPVMFSTVLRSVIHQYERYFLSDLAGSMWAPIS